MWPALKPAARRLGALSVLASLAAACATTKPAPPPPPPDPTAPAPFFERLPYNARPLPAAARVFLVAGSPDVANFAEEVLAQRTLWRRAGVPDEAIACYYAKPLQGAFARDEAQFRRLADALRDCYPAAPGTLHAHLRQAARRQPGFVYLFVTAHGVESRLGRALRSREAAQRAFAMALQNPTIRGALDQPTLELAAAGAPRLEDTAAAGERLLRGGRPEEVGLTPETLMNALRAFPRDTQKFLVLQACFSGGFIVEAQRGRLSILARRIPNLTVLTAARPDRTSFGCSPGEEMTHFGGALTRALEDVAAQGRQPPTVPWLQVWRRVAGDVGTIERGRRVRRSHPGFFSNRDGGPPILEFHEHRPPPET